MKSFDEWAKETGRIHVYDGGKHPSAYIKEWCEALRDYTEAVLAEHLEKNATLESVLRDVKPVNVPFKEWKPGLPRNQGKSEAEG